MGDSPEVPTTTRGWVDELALYRALLRVSFDYREGDPAQRLMTELARVFAADEAALFLEDEDGLIGGFKTMCKELGGVELIGITSPARTRCCLVSFVDHGRSQGQAIGVNLGDDRCRSSTQQVGEFHPRPDPTNSRRQTAGSDQS